MQDSGEDITTMYLCYISCIPATNLGLESEVWIVLLYSSRLSCGQTKTLVCYRPCFWAIVCIFFCHLFEENKCVIFTKSEEWKLFVKVNLYCSELLIHLQLTMFPLSTWNETYIKSKIKNRTNLDIIWTDPLFYIKVAENIHPCRVVACQCNVIHSRYSRVGMGKKSYPILPRSYPNPSQILSESFTDPSHNLPGSFP